MAKLSHEAVSASIKSLTDLDLSPQENSLIEAFLVAKRLAALHKDSTITNTDNIVREVFGVLPNHSKGRLQPTRKIGSAWKDNKPDSGRKTVWNAATRQGAKQLFAGDHMENGLLPNAADRLGELIQGKKLPREALLAFLLRDSNFPSSPITLHELESQASSDFDLNTHELEQFTEPHDLGVPLEGQDTWDPDKLDASLAPPAGIGSSSSIVGTIPSPMEDIEIDGRIERMIRQSIASSKAVVLVGPPGTGKSTILDNLSKNICEDPQEIGLSSAELPEPLWVTAEESWTARDLIGGETLVDGRLVFQPGFLLQAISENRWLIIDELNRADMDRILGPVFTWLSGARSVPAVTVGRVTHGGDPVILKWGNSPDCSVENRAVLGDHKKKPTGKPVEFLAGTDWRLLGTYNAVDAQRVFRIGQALGRRFSRVPIPPLSVDAFSAALAKHAPNLKDVHRGRIVSLYGSHLAERDTALGPALFFKVSDFVSAALKLHDDETEQLDETTVPAIAEGYLVSVGSWLVRLDPEVLESLGSRLCVPAGPISEQEWAWLKEMLPNLG